MNFHHGQQIKILSACTAPSEASNVTWGHLGLGNGHRGGSRGTSSCGSPDPGGASMLRFCEKFEAGVLLQVLVVILW